MSYIHKYALFDFDGTLIKGDSIVWFFLYAFRRHLVSLSVAFKAIRSVLSYSLGFSDRAHSKEIAYSFLKGQTREAMDSLGDAFCREALLPMLRPQGLATLELLRKDGYTVLLISASVSFYMKHLSKYLPVDSVLSTELQFDSENRFTGRIDGKNCSGKEKTERLDRYLQSVSSALSYENSVAYGDSGSDYPMMLCCRGRFGVNPKKKLLKLLQADPQAEILHWSEPVKPGVKI